MMAASIADITQGKNGESFLVFYYSLSVETCICQLLAYSWCSTYTEYPLRVFPCYHALPMAWGILRRIAATCVRTTCVRTGSHYCLHAGVWGWVGDEIRFLGPIWQF